MRKNMLDIEIVDYDMMTNSVLIKFTSLQLNESTTLAFQPFKNNFESYQEFIDNVIDQGVYYVKDLIKSKYFNEMNMEQEFKSRIGEKYSIDIDEYIKNKEEKALAEAIKEREVNL